MGKLDEGLNMLADVVTAKTGMAACLAAWALDHQGDKAKPVLGKLEKAAPNGRYPDDALNRVIKRLKGA